MRELELLAPARNIEIGIAAIDCGADAVYLAGPSFGARQAAGNSVDDIRRLCAYAHRFGARVFVTLNTILFDDELPEAFALALELQESGVDALIVQDFALAAFELEHPDLLTVPLHASTQCSIRTVEDAARLDALGFSRIVLERELPMSAVREICSAVSCEVEAFVHGALCVCYSGQCYLSEMLAGRSANRGECVQACRSRYDLVNGRGELVRWPAEGEPCMRTGRKRHMSGGTAGKPVAEGRTLLSLRDLKLIDRLDEMAGGGVTSFKIEGRLKSISYVRNVVGAYSAALDRVVAAGSGKYRRASFGRSEPAFTPSPGKSFNRGFTELFFDGIRGKWACLDAGKALGEKVGTAVSVSRRGNGVKVTVEKVSGQSCGIRFHNGDGFSFIGSDGKEGGFRADVCEGDVIVCGSDVKFLVPGTILYRNLDTAFEKELERGATRRIGVSLSVSISNVSSAPVIPADSAVSSAPVDSASLSVSSESDAVIGGGDAGRTYNGEAGTLDFILEVEAVSEDGRKVRHVETVVAEAARNRERILGMIRGQLGKDYGIYSFSVAGISDCGAVPMMSSAHINGIRRAIAEKLDRRDCIALPVARRRIRRSVPPELAFPEHLTYKSDVANALAASFYRR